MLEFIEQNILKKKFNSNASRRQWWIINKREDDFDKLLELSDNIQEAIYLTINPKTETKCLCGKHLTFKKFSIGYSDFCLNNCKYKKENTQKKREKTNLLKYGVSNISHLQETKDKISKINSQVMGQPSVQEKRKKTNAVRHNDEKYNNRKQSHLTKIKNGSYAQHRATYQQTLAKKQLNHLNQYEWSDEQKQLLTKESLTIMHLTKSLLEISEICQVNKNTISSLFNKFNIKVIIHKTSSQQKEIESFIKSLNVKYEMNNRSILSGKELDFVFDNFAIEYNGLYYHSNIDSNYHLNKTELCEKINLQLFHIFENEWIKHKDIWKSMIRNKLNLCERIYARKCLIKTVSNKDTKNFLNDNHMQQYNSSSINYGLYYNDKLVSLMTFGKNRYLKNSESESESDFELYRFCNALNVTVVGGASKLLRHFERNNSPKSLITFANRRWSQGQLYEKLDFKKVHNTAPNFFYFKSDYVLHSRIKFQKHKLKEFKNYDINKSAKRIMLENNFRIIYDSGNIKYKKEY